MSPDPDFSFRLRFIELPYVPLKAIGMARSKERYAPIAVLLDAIVLFQHRAS